MHLNNIGKNVNEIKNSKGTILFSYRTPVAVITQDGTVLRTNRKYSRTTSKHINQWLGSLVATEVDPEVIKKYAD